MGTRRLRALIVMATGILILGACGGNDAPGSAEQPPEEQGNGQSANMVELISQCDSVREQYPSLVGATVDIASSPLPGQLIADPEAPKGFAGEFPDQIKALSACLGWADYSLESLSWDGIIPAVQSGRFPMALVGMYNTPERRKQVAFVEYATVKEVVVVPEGNPLNITKAGAPDLCGVSVSMATGSYEEAVLTEISEQCVDSGEPPIDLQRYASFSEAFQAVVSGRADAHINGGPTALAFLEENPGFEIGGEPFPGPTMSLTLNKSETTLQKAVLEAYKIMKSTGVTREIFEEWDTIAGASIVDPELYCSGCP